MISDAILDLLVSALVAPPARWLWARYWPTLRDRLLDMFDGTDDS